MPFLETITLYITVKIGDGVVVALPVARLNTGLKSEFFQTGRVVSKARVWRFVNTFTV